MLDTQEAAEAKYKKWEKDPPPFGWDGMFQSVTHFSFSDFHFLPSIYACIYRTPNVIAPIGCLI